MASTSYKTAKIAVKVGAIVFGGVASSMMFDATEKYFSEIASGVKSLFQKKESSDISDEEVLE